MELYLEVVWCAWHGRLPHQAEKQGLGCEQSPGCDPPYLHVKQVMRQEQGSQEQGSGGRGNREKRHGVGWDLKQIAGNMKDSMGAAWESCC